MKQSFRKKTSALYQTKQIITITEFSCNRGVCIVGYSQIEAVYVEGELRKKENFFTDNSDLMFHLQNFDFLQELFPFTTKKDKDAVGASNAQEYVETWMDALSSFGEAIGTEVAPRIRAVEDEKLTLDERDNLVCGEALRKNIALLKEMGIAQFGTSSAYGGLGAPFIVQCCVFEMLFRACPSTTVNTIFYGTFAHILEMYGTKEICEKYAPKLANAEFSGCMCLTEPATGSDLGAITAYGEKQANGTYLVHGGKRFVTNGTAELAFVLARTSKDVQGLQHLSFFIVPRFKKGGESNYRVMKLEDKLGLRGSATCDLHFDGAEGELLGEEDKGLSYMLTLMNGARIVTGFQGIGNLEAVKRLAEDYANERTTWGKKIAQHGLIAEKLRDMDVELKAIRSLCYKAAFRQSFIDLAKTRLETLPDVERKQLEEKITSYRRRIRQWIPLIKYWVGENTIKHARNALQIHGGYGFSREYLPELWLRQSVILSIYEGTSQIQALMCVKDMLKDVLRNPRAFIEKKLALSVKGLSETNQLRKKLNKGKQLVNSAITNILLTLIKQNFAKMPKADLLKGMEKLKKNLKLQTFDHALLNAERICEMQCLVALSESLVWDAESDKTREQIAQRYLDKALPQLTRLKSEIEASGSFS